MTGEFILRIVVAGIFGGLIGFEREFRSKEAGLRTHFLVALGSALFMIISQYGFEGVQAGRFDVSRVAAQVVTGIGFIGAGIIIFQKNAVRGLTTAAGLWVTAAIGLGCGGGMYLLSGIAALLVLIVLEVVHYLLPQFGEKSVTLKIAAVSKEALIAAIDSFRERKIHVSSYSVKVVEDRSALREDLPENCTTGRIFKASVDIRVRHENYVAILSKLLDDTPGVNLLGIE